MVEFFCITLAFFFLCYLVIERLQYGMKVDSIEGDMRRLWNQFDCTREDMGL